MNRKKNSGFTLIELLAVIVILAIIALIAVPIVKSITKDAKMKSFMNSARGIVRAGDLYYSRKDMMDEIDGEIVFEFPDNASELEVNGKLPEEGKMIINTDGDIALAITNGKYCITKSFEEAELTVTDDYEECVIPAGNTELVATLSSLATTSTTVTSIPSCLTNGTTCASGTPVAIKVNASEVYNFYVISEANNEIVLIMDRNLYSETDDYNGNVAWISASDYNTANSEEGDNTVCDYDSCNDEGPITAVQTLKERTSSWSNIPEKVYTYSDDGGGNKYAAFTETMRARMLTYTEVNKILTDNSNIMPSWLYINSFDTGDDNTWGYWLSAAYAGDSLCTFSVACDGTIFEYNAYDDADFGIRPVITLSK